MNELPIILLVEDDDFAAKVTATLLASKYVVHHVENGQEALNFVAHQTPDLMLLDVSMPGLSGYEVCRTLRNDPAIEKFPIIFLSGLISEEDRLAGFEAGGDDYLSKPVSAAELQQKISLSLKNYAERRSMKEDLSNTFATAMTAMTSAADMGTVFQFLQASFKCTDYDALSHEVMKTLASYGAQSSVQIRGQSGCISISSNGPCSPLETSVLANMAKHDRLFDFSSCLSCSYEHITIIIKNIDRNDADRHGRLRDNLALLAEGANMRIDALDSSAALEKEQQALTQLITNTRQTLANIDQHHRQQRIDSKRIFENLQVDFERRMLTIGITVSQEDELSELITNACNQSLALYDQGQSIEVHMKKLLEQLEVPQIHP
ncbi:MAG: response regulator [Proteobacteria bacterium]|nr:response regulator [Pseudomonadota bacterium]